MHAAREAGLGEVQKLRRDSVVEGTKMWSRDLGATWRLAAIAVVTGCLLGGCTASVPNQMPDTSEQYGVSPAAGSPTSTRGATPPADYLAMQRQLKQQLTGGGDLSAVRSVLVSVDGRAVIKYYRNSTPDDYAHVFSVTKSVMSILVGIAVDEGRLRPDQTLRELLPQQASSMTEEEASITLRQLLTMTSGIPGGSGALHLSSTDTVSQVLEYGITSDPGAAFQYSDAGAHLVAAVLREAVGRPILDYAREKLFDPLGIDTRPAWEGWDQDPRSGFAEPGFGWVTDRSGLNVGGFGLKLKAPDLVKIGELYVNGGRWHGRQIVSAAWVEESTSPKLTPEQAKIDGQYGYLWWVGEYTGHPVFAASGSYYQKIFCFPGPRLVVVVTAAAGSGPDTTYETLDPVIERVIFDPLLAG